MPSPGASATQDTPLAPSVEKAYYRKCIELKRRLNEVEEANDSARLRKLRLNRAIMKMRLERAFLLDQLAKRMELDDDEESKQAIGNSNSSNYNNSHHDNEDEDEEIEDKQRQQQQLEQQNGSPSQPTV
ncbi:hypothetical protein AAFC00_004020 [Neodothiora populina]|uniref:INO80 complex subunit F domain-containing protein n=1 Tax=Neodothiora populina TaxID=2781224 RepID=A0ABR3PII2_9PEZI